MGVSLQMENPCEGFPESLRALVNKAKCLYYVTKLNVKIAHLRTDNPS